MSYSLTLMGGLLESRQRGIVSQVRSSQGKGEDGGPSSHTPCLPE